MADIVRKAECYYVEVPDKAGEGAKVLSGLKKAGLNLLAFSGFPRGPGKAEIDLIASDPAALKSAAAKIGLQLHGPKTCFLIEGEDRVGAVAETAKKLAGAGVNIAALDALAVGGGRYGGIVWVADADVESATKALDAKPLPKEAEAA